MVVGCDLREAARITPWFHEDDVCWVAACEALRRSHGGVEVSTAAEPPDTQVGAHAGRPRAGWPTTSWAKGGWSFDRVMRQIPDHFQRHARLSQLVVPAVSGRR